MTIGARCAVLLALLAAPARADSPAFSPAMSPGSEGGSRYETTVHARPRREAGTAIVLTARDLERRGVDNLAEALALIPEVSLRQGGRGTIQLDLRGAKQRSVLILIDGVPVDEPYFGSFDLASIPITDIVEIRVSLSPASPLEGPGGDGGVVEVQTLHATGGRRVNGRLEVSSSPTVQAAVTGRGDLSSWLSLRASAGGRHGEEHYPIVNGDGSPGVFNDRSEGGHGALRLEHVTKRGSITADAWAEHRSYFVPPSDTAGASLSAIRGEDSARVVLGAEIVPGPWRLAIGAYTDLLTRATDYYADYAQKNKTGHESLFTDRSGAAVHVDRQIGRFLQLSSRLSFDSELADDHLDGQKPVSARSTFSELAVGALLHWRWLRLEAALGVAAPIASRVMPWPEAKLTIAVALTPLVQLRLTGARKGRVPTLRELFAPNQGNASLDPEQSTFAELQLLARPIPLLSLRVAGYFRYAQGLIRLDGTRAHFANLDDIYVRGLDAGVEVAREKIVGGGVAYLFADASSPSPVLGLEPIENFPRHRVDAWLSANWRGQVGGLARARYVSDRLDQGVRLPQYAVVDLSVWWRVRRELRVTGRCDNLADTRFEVRNGVASLGRVAELVLDGTWE